MKKDLRVFDSFEEARDIANSLKGWPAARVMTYRHGGYVVRYDPSKRDYYPALERAK